MQDTTTTPRVETVLKPERPKMHKVILLNDDFTPREFVTMVLKAEFRGVVKNLGRYAARWIAGWPNRPSSTAALT